MSDPWAFGWTQIFTLFGFAVTIAIAVGSFRTFNRWKREKIEEKRLEIALEALSLAYEAQMVFEDIQRRFVAEYEWADMPSESLSVSERERRQSLYAVIGRMGRHVEFFERSLRLQPRFMAVFGRDTDGIFKKLYRARNNIQASIEVLISLSDPTIDDEQLIAQMRAEVWNLSGPKVKEPLTKKLVREFQDDIERICLPLVEHELHAPASVDCK